MISPAAPQLAVVASEFAEVVAHSEVSMVARSVNSVTARFAPPVAAAVVVWCPATGMPESAAAARNWKK